MPAKIKVSWRGAICNAGYFSELYKEKMVVKMYP